MSHPDDHQTPPHDGPYPPGTGYPPPGNPTQPPAGPGPYPPAGPMPGQPGPGHGGFPPPPGGFPPPPPGGFPPPAGVTPPTGGFPPPPGGFPPPGQPYDPHQAPAFAPPPKKSNVGKIVLIVLAVLLVLCVGGATAIWFAVKDTVGEAVDASRTRVVAPDTLAGRPKITDPELQRASDEIVQGIQAEVENETSAVGAFYGDRAAQELIMVAGVSGMIADPKAELDEAIQGLAKEIVVSNMAAVEPGPLGGEASCGDGQTEEVPLGICVWADRGSVGMFVMYFSSRADAEAEFVTIRGQIEKRD
ncbi:hypothetical protein [Micromonospora endophytica]|uniref:hypothetical protein n=1 Tax=Micromonospora endophytica TaxID=515350 RepID=UPI0015E88A54|nr:hypothetical protein [Micromonospora endophytica]